MTESDESLIAQVKVRPYLPGDEPGLVDTWNSALHADPVDVTTWRSRVLLDPNFDPEGCLVAEADGVVRGFVLSLVRRVPFFNDGLQPEVAWISAMGVHPKYQYEGIGSALIRAAEERLRRLGRKTVLVSPYVPNYFTPGVDVHAYPDGVAFFERQGYLVTSRPISMRAELTGFRVPEPIAATKQRLIDEGIEVRLAVPSDIVPVLDFLPRHFTWDWHREASGVFADLFAGEPRQVSLLVATRGDEVLGYAQHRAERFGPFGVRQDMRGHGIGRVLLADTLLEMRKKNFHCAWFLWTGDDAARLYAQCGFHEVRRFAVLRKSL